MRLVITGPAARDLDAIIDYIALDSPKAAKAVFRGIVAGAEGLKDFPGMGRAGRLAGTRELALPGLPYLIVYEASDEVVTILAVFHGARDLPRALAERRKGLKP